MRWPKFSKPENLQKENYEALDFRIFDPPRKSKWADATESSKSMQSADLNTRSCLSLFEVLILTQSTLSAKCRNVSIGYLVAALRGQDGVGAFGRDCEANYGNGVQWSVPLTASHPSLLSISDATQLNVGTFALQQLCFQNTSVSGTFSRFSNLLHVLYLLWCSTSRPRPRPYWHSNILREFPANK